MTITVVDRDRILAAEIANQLVTDYLELRNRPRRRAEETGLATLKQQFQVLEAEVVTAKARLDELRVTLVVPNDF